MKVAVIGAGASGLAAIKACLDEGLQPVCFEQRDNCGGMWYYSDSVVEGQASVMRSTVINSNKESMAFSDFPPPANYPNHMHNVKLLAYLRQYADHFSLTQHIRFNTQIKEVKRAADFSTSGQWVLIVRDCHTGVSSQLTFDAVMVCSGHHADAYRPHFTGSDSFTGQILHSHDYRHFAGFEGKRVIVVGIGNSGLDVSVELSHVCSQVYLSTRRGAWIVSRIGDKGVPVDALRQRRIVLWLMGLLPWSIKNSMLEKASNMRFDHTMYGLKPDHRYLSQHPTINDALPNRLSSGTLVIKPNIKLITDSSVQFDDGSTVDNIDAIILATGYTFGFPFLEKEVVDVKNNEVNLYKYIFPPHLQPPTLAIIGCVQPVGSLNPISEMQSRLATRVFKGDVRLPETNVMLADIARKRALMAKQYVQAQRYTIQVPYVSYMDELAQLNGNSIRLSKLWFTDPRLAVEILCGITTPYQFRLFGPGKWEGARNAILSQNDRLLKSMMTRTPPPDTSQRYVTSLLKLAIALSACALLTTVALKKNHFGLAALFH